jgi:uncharacterized protein (DUF983 family)
MTKRINIIQRCLQFKCPKCGHFSFIKNWFRIKKECENCSLNFARDESGFYFGTTSIGYVISIVFVILPICILVILNHLSVWFAVFLAILVSLLLNIILYPLLLSWVLMSYFFLQPESLEENY